MSATAALILLVEAASACGAVAPTRPGVAADAVPAILDIESRPFEALALTLASAAEATAVPPSDAMPETDQPDAGAAAPQCKVIPIELA